MPKCIAQTFLRLYVHEFLSDFLDNCKIENRQNEIYISITDVTQLFIIIDIKLFKVK